jgi:predicted transcriptional regulator
MVSTLVDRLFEGDAGALVHHLLSESEVNRDELARLRRLIAERDAGEEGDG